MSRNQRGIKESSEVQIKLRLVKHKLALIWDQYWENLTVEEVDILKKFAKDLSIMIKNREGKDVKK